MRPIDFLRRGVARGPDAIALAAPAEPLTYARLEAEVDALAAAFQWMDPTPGSRVGLCAWNTREHLLAQLAAYAAGKAWIALNPRNGRAELDAMVAATRPALIVADESCLGRFTPTGAPVVIGKCERDGDDARPTVRGLIARFAGRAPAAVDPSPDDAQVIKFSGGSTGRPKPVVQSVRCIDALVRGILEVFEFDPADANLIAAPLTHGASCFVLPLLAAGGRHVLLEDPAPRSVLEALRSHDVTTAYLPPALIHALVAEAGAGGRSFPRLRHLIYSAAPMSPDRIREAQRVFGPVIETAYGQVEAPQIISAMRASELLLERNLTSVGRPSPVARVMIMDPQGGFLPAGETGEVVVQGELLMTGYLDRPDLTAQTIVDGWLHTGDLGLLDERGYLYLRGRLGERINTGGFKVHPEDIEAALARHPAVAECCVFGVAHPKWGEAVHAAVRLAPGASTTEAALVAFVKTELDSVKAPKHVHFVSELPRNPAGKINRGAVRARVLREDAPAP